MRLKYFLVNFFLNYLTCIKTKKEENTNCLNIIFVNMVAETGEELSDIKSCVNE